MTVSAVAVIVCVKRDRFGTSTNTDTRTSFQGYGRFGRDIIA